MEPICLLRLDYIHMSLQETYHYTKRLADYSFPELGVRVGRGSSILRRIVPWEADRIVLNRAITMSLTSFFCLSQINSLNFRSIADC